MVPGERTRRVLRRACALEMDTPTADDAKRLMASVAGDRLEPLILHTLVTGSRRGEVLSPRWRNVDPEARIIHVGGQYQKWGRAWQWLPLCRNVVIGARADQRAAREDSWSRQITADQRPLRPLHARLPNTPQPKCRRSWGEVEPKTPATAIGVSLGSDCPRRSKPVHYRTGFESVAWCQGPESNWGHCDFQSHALPTELPWQNQPIVANHRPSSQTHPALRISSGVMRYSIVSSLLSGDEGQGVGPGAATAYRPASL